MANDGRRPDRVAEAIREEVARFLTEGAKDPRITGLVTVTAVDVKRDLRHARIFVSILGTDAEKASTLEGLHSLASHLRSRVAQAIRLRNACELEFVMDESIAHAARIESLLAQIKDGTLAPPDASDLSYALVLVDKPAGISSHDVVALVRRALGTRKVGHGGTLDPFATGLLLLMSGRGTRLLQFVPAEPKVYEATIRFGSETETDDVTGSVTVTTDARPTLEAIRAAILSLTGELRQVPPAYSAKHVDGERAYALARRGERPALAAATVHVHAWEALESTDDVLRARISCGTGTYIRSLARDLGRAVGSAAHLAQLRRVRVGPFDVANADGIERLRDGEVQRRPLHEALGTMPQDVLDEGDVRRIRHGMSVPATIAGGRGAPVAAESRGALVAASGELVAIATRRGDAWYPDVVLASA